MNTTQRADRHAYARVRTARTYGFNPDNVTWVEDDGQSIRFRFRGDDRDLVFHRATNAPQYDAARDAAREADLVMIEPAS